MRAHNGGTVFELNENDQERLTSAIISSIQLWSDPRYIDILDPVKQTFFSRDWFEWFLKEWSVRRTVDKNSRNTIRLYINNQFRKRLLKTKSHNYVDDAATYCGAAGYGAIGRSPRSLLSKVAFFVKPEVYVPMDSWGKKGLEIFFDKYENEFEDRGDEGSSAIYADYLMDFNEVYYVMESVISREIRKNWVRSLSSQRRLGRRICNSNALKRKILDEFLMSLGGRWNVPKYRSPRG